MASSRAAARRIKIDRNAVASLAAYGLTEPEICLKLGLPASLSATQAAALAAAIREGRLRGSTEMKVAQFEAAKKGQASAQAKVLELLRDNDDEEGIEVVREIYGKGEEEET